MGNTVKRIAKASKERKKLMMKGGGNGGAVSYLISRSGDTEDEVGREVSPTNLFVVVVTRRRRHDGMSTGWVAALALLVIAEEGRDWEEPRAQSNYPTFGWSGQNNLNLCNKRTVKSRSRWAPSTYLTNRTKKRGKEEWRDRRNIYLYIYMYLRFLGLSGLLLEHMSHPKKLGSNISYNTKITWVKNRLKCVITTVNLSNHCLDPKPHWCRHNHEFWLPPKKKKKFIHFYCIYWIIK